MDKDTKILTYINKEELVNKVILSWFPEIKQDEINSDEEAIDLYRV